MSEVNIRIAGQDASGQALDSARQGVDDLKTSSQGLTGTLDGLSRVGTTLTGTMTRVHGLMTRLDLVQLTLQAASERVAVSQLKYNEAVKDFGPASRQAIEAQRNLESASRNLEKAQQRSKATAFLFGAEVASLGFQLPKLVMTMRALSVATFAGAAANTAFAVTLTFGVAAVSIAAGLVAAKIAMDKFTASSDVSNTSLQGLGETQKTLAEQTQDFAEAQTAAYGAVGSSLGRFGVELKNLTASGEGALGRALGLDSSFLAALQTARVSEDALAATAFRANKALRDQAHVTAQKGETTADLIERLQILGFTEEEIRARFDESTMSLLSQKEAAEKDAQALEDLARATEKAALKSSEFTSGNSRIVRNEHAPPVAAAASWHYQGPVGPAPPAPAYQPPAGFTPTYAPAPSSIEGNPAFIGPTMGSPPKYSGYNPNGTAAAQQGPQPRRAAHGFHGDVNRPTLFMAGESGTERVDVTPRGGRGPRGVSAKSINVNIYLSPGDGDEAGVERGVTRGLGIAAQRAAALRV